jgi:hypothetical protein
MNSSKTTAVWVIIIIVLVIIVGLVAYYIYIWSGSSNGANPNNGLPPVQNQLSSSTAATPSSSTPATSGTPFTTAELENGTYSLFGDTFTLANGRASITGHSFGATSTPLIPIGYTYAAGANGDIVNDLEGNPEQGNVVAMYRSFGADLEWVALFAVTNENGSAAQIASGIVYQNDSKIQSVSVDNVMVTLNLLVVSAANQNLPHYEQTPTSLLTLQFEIQNGQFITVSNASSANGKG